MSKKIFIFTMIFAAMISSQMAKLLIRAEDPQFIRFAAGGEQNDLGIGFFGSHHPSFIGRVFQAQVGRR